MSLDAAIAKLAVLVHAANAQAASPLLVMLAGSNGAGKSTFHDAYLAPLGLPFVNADRIAAGLVSPRAPRTASGPSRPPGPKARSR
jgi:putative protein kinase ArgK-like GTPase of G3E family